MEDKRTRKFNIAFYPDEYEEVKKYAKAKRKSVSEFIREAIEERIRRIDNPDYYNGVVKQVRNGINKVEAKQDQHQKVMKGDLGRLYAKVSEDMKELKDISEMKRKVITESDLILATSTIRELVKEHGVLGIGEIQQSTGFDKKTITSVLSNSKLFDMKMNSKFSLRGVKKWTIKK